MEYLYVGTFYLRMKQILRIILAWVFLSGCSETQLTSYPIERACNQDFYDAIVAIAPNSNYYVSIQIERGDTISLGVLELWILWKTVSHTEYPSEELIKLITKEISIGEEQLGDARIEYLDSSEKVNSILEMSEEDIKASFIRRNSIKRNLHLSRPEIIALIDRINSWCALPYFDDESGYLVFQTQEKIIEWYRSPWFKAEG